MACESMRRHGERLRTPNDCREILFNRSDVELEMAIYRLAAGHCRQMWGRAEQPVSKL